jgi:hypothetical protein
VLVGAFMASVGRREVVMLFMKRTITLGLLAAIGGCADSLTSPQGASSLPSLARDEGERNEVLQSVTGSAYFHIPSEQNGVETYTVSAIRHRDGSVSGESELRSDIGGGFRIRGPIACFGVTANVARLAMRVTESTNPNVVPGNYLIWSLADNGEGTRQAPDATSQVYRVYLEEEATYHCAVGMNITTLFAIERGNLQVR